MTDRSYHHGRAEEEAERASRCDDPDVARAHLELAALHRRKALELGRDKAFDVLKLSGTNSVEKN